MGHYTIPPPAALVIMHPLCRTRRGAAWAFDRATIKVVGLPYPIAFNQLAWWDYGPPPFFFTNGSTLTTLGSTLQS